MTQPVAILRLINRPYVRSVRSGVPIPEGGNWLVVLTVRRSSAG